MVDWHGALVYSGGKISVCHGFSSMKLIRLRNTKLDITKLEGGILMGEHSRFREGQKSPKNAVYMEIGESGAGVQDPMIIELSKGEKFPATRNKNRVWTQK
ncbi:YjzC family protein [Brevibacillus reuszeri]|uniref:YjzC family protein n=2 Tax=Brevibacillus reuszeri TaxID=54915 RepID=UPI0035B51731